MYITVYNIYLTQQTGQLGQPITSDAHGIPLSHGAGTNALVKLDTGLVPLEDRPLQAATVEGDDLLGQLDEQTLAIALASRGRLDKQILKVDARLGSPCAIVVEVQGHADCLALFVVNQ